VFNSTRREIISGSAAVGTVTTFCGTTSDVAISGKMVSPGMSIQTVLRIDGREHRVAHDIRASLLDTLRAELGLEMNQQCTRAQCGACTVHLNGAPRLACLTLTVAAQGEEITTSRAVAPAVPLDPISAGFSISPA